MRTDLLRWLLDPATCFRALRLIRAQENPMDFDTAWRACRLARRPEEISYLLHGHQLPGTAESDHPRHQSKRHR